MRFAVVFFAAALTAACANPAQFAPTVETFATATKSTQSAVVEIEAVAGAEFRATLLDASLAAPGSVSVPEGECTTSSSACTVVVKHYGIAFDLSVEKLVLIRSQLEFLDALSDYAQALSQLATAQNQAEIDAVAEKVASAVQKVGAVPSPISPIAVFAQPIGRAAAWLVGEAQDTAKMSALRKATADMKIALVKPAATLSDSVAAIYEKRIRDAARRFDNAQTVWLEPSTRNAAALADYIAAAAALDKVLVRAPGPTLKALVDAHDALELAVRTGRAPDATLRGQIENFAVSAKRLAEVARDFRKAAQAATP